MGTMVYGNVNPNHGDDSLGSGTLGEKLRQRIEDHTKNEMESQAQAARVELERRASQAVKDITQAVNDAISQSPPPVYIELRDPENVLLNILEIDELARLNHLGRLVVTSEMVSPQGLRIIQFCESEGLVMEISKDNYKYNSFNSVYIWFAKNR